jgi:hypothetical protein
MTKLDWEINIENLAAKVAETYGSEVVEAIFARYDSTCFDDLYSAVYDQLFGDLMQMESDP